MPRARANGLELEYETFGDPSRPPLLLIMGLGAQMVLWDEQFCELLAGRGYFVIRYDNRDVGKSSKCEDRGVPDVMAAMSRALSGQAVDAPYTLSDMAADAAGLLDAFGLAAAHVVGASMGGMIAQTLAIEHAPRVRSLTSIMSTTGNPSLPQPQPEALSVLLIPPPPERDANIERAVQVFRTIGSPGFPFDEARIRNRAALSFDRGYYPAGVVRQLVAILASGSRADRLRGVTAPTVVVHGQDDPLVPVEGGMDTAASIPGARLEIIDGMGHDMPTQAWPRILDAIDGVARRS